MASIPDPQLDLMLAQCEGTNVHVCTQVPTNYTEASVTYNIATEAVSGVNYVKSGGVASGRKNTCTPPTGTTINNAGTATHIAVTNGSNAIVLTTTCTSQVIGESGTVDIGAFVHELQDPT